MAKHTEGPWTSHELEDGRFSVVHWGPLAYVGADEPGVAEANAALMAAAPELLEALVQALGALDCGSVAGLFQSEGEQSWHNSTVKKARAAIAKAKA